MELDEIRQLIATGESETVEFKEYVPGRWQELKSKIAIAICALANTKGGVVVIGVNDGGQILRAAGNPTLIAEQLKDLLHTGLSFPLVALVRKAEIDGKWLHWVEVSKYRGPEPVTCQKKIYLRRCRHSSHKVQRVLEPVRH